MHSHTVVDPKEVTATSDYARSEVLKSSERKPRAGVLGFCCGEAGRSSATGYATLGTRHCVPVVAAVRGLRRGRAGEQEPSHPSLTRALPDSFIPWSSLWCLPHLQQRKTVQVPYFLLVLMGMQFLRTQIGACKIKTVLPIARIYNQVIFSPLYVKYQASHSG